MDFKNANHGEFQAFHQITQPDLLMARICLFIIKSLKLRFFILLRNNRMATYLGVIDIESYPNFTGDL
tara:strand:- start:647 stop:850 length:204 start_codon:yes stop_codon:yes gene_type:complete